MAIALNFLLILQRENKPFLGNLHSKFFIKYNNKRYKNNLLVLVLKNNTNARYSNCRNFLKSLVPSIVEMFIDTYGKLYGYGKNLKNIWIIRSQVVNNILFINDAVQRLNGYPWRCQVRYSPPTFERSWNFAPTVLQCSDIAHNQKFCTLRAKITILNKKHIKNIKNKNFLNKYQLLILIINIISIQITTIFF